MTAANLEFRKAITSRYIRAIFAGYGGVVLALALATNLLMHHWLFNQISNAVGLYRSMALVILGLSIDFFVLALVATCDAVYTRFMEGGMYRDLQLAAVQPWEAVRPLAFIVFWSVMFDTLIEAGFATFVLHDPPAIKVLGFLIGLAYGLCAGLFLSGLILLFCLYRVPSTLQLSSVVAISFSINFAVTTLADSWQPGLASWGDNSGWRERLALNLSGSSELWRSYATYTSYYFALGGASSILGATGLALHFWARRSSNLAYLEKRKSGQLRPLE